MRLWHPKLAPSLRDIFPHVLSAGLATREGRLARYFSKGSEEAGEC
ncbi:hypothetical protein ACVILL_000828 [Bradyrhizobium sp. USDA 3364]